MDAIEQIFGEVDQQAGSPEGFLRLVQLLFTEVDKVKDWTTEEAKDIYRNLLRVYVIAKRRAAYLKGTSGAGVLESQSIRNQIKEKRQKAKECGAKLNPDVREGIKQEVGSEMLNMGHRGVTLPPASIDPNKIPRLNYTAGQIGEAFNKMIEQGYGADRIFVPPEDVIDLRLGLPQLKPWEQGITAPEMKGG